MFESKGDHILGKVHWQTSCHDPSFVSEFQQTVSDFTNNEFRDLIESWAGSINPDARSIILPEILLDLGSLPPTNLKFHLVLKTKEALAKLDSHQLTWELQKPSGKDFENRLRNLHFSLQTGLDASNEIGSVEKDILIEFCELLRFNRRQTIKLILSDSQDRFRADLLLRKASADNRELCLQLVSPLYGSRVVSLIHKLINFHGFRRYSYRKIQELNLLFFENSLTYLLHSAFSGFNEKVWLDLMVEILQRSDENFQLRPQLTSHLGIGDFIQQLDEPEIQLTNTSDSSSGFEMKSFGHEIDAERFLLQLEKKLSQFKTVGFDLVLGEKLISDLDKLAFHDQVNYLKLRWVLLTIVSGEINSGSELPASFKEKIMQLYFENDYSVLKAEILNLVNLLFPSRKDELFHNISDHIIKVLSHQDEPDVNISDLIYDVIQYLSNTYSATPFSIFEMVIAGRNWHEKGYHLLAENSIWRKFVLNGSPTVDKYRHSKHLPDQDKVFLSKQSGSRRNDFQETDNTYDFAKSLDLKVKELLQSKSMNNEVLAALYQIFELQPELVADAMFQHYNGNSFYGPLAITSPDFWINVHEKLFTKSGPAIHLFLRNLEVLSYVDSHIEFMLPLVGRKLFIIAYGNPDRSPSEVVAQSINYIRERPLLPFEQKFVDVAQILTMPGSYSENERMMQAYKRISKTESPFGYKELSQYILESGTHLSNESDFMLMIQNLNRFYFEELKDLNEELQRHVAVKLAGVKVSMADIREFYDENVKSSFHKSEDYYSDLATELFWDNIIMPQTCSNKSEFIKSAIKIPEADKLILRPAKYKVPIYERLADSHLADDSIIALKIHPHTCDAGVTGNDFLPDNLVTEYRLVSGEAHYIASDEKTIGFAEFSRLIKEKDVREVSHFCRLTSLEEIALILDDSGTSDYFNFCTDLRRFKASIRRLPEQFQVREEVLTYQVLSILDETDFAESWKTAFKAVTETIGKEARSLSESTAIYFGNRALTEIFETKPVAKVPGLRDLKTTTSNIMPFSNDESPLSDISEWESLSPSEGVKVVKYVLERNRLPVWVRNQNKSKPSVFISCIFRTHPEYIRTVLLSAVNESLISARLLQYLPIRNLVGFLVDYNFISRTEGEEYIQVQTNLSEDRIGTRNAVGQVLVRYWLASKCEKVSKDKFYRGLLLFNYRNSFQTTHQFKVIISNHIHRYPSEFQLAFSRLFAQRDRSGILRKLPEALVTKRNLNEVLKKGLRISNAGIVLINSYLKELFSRLSLLENNQFLSMKHRQKAILALHYFVSGSDVIGSQQEIVINKVLCGFAMDDILETKESLTVNDKEVVDGLISAMISHWSAIKTSSINGFRGNWLIRDGVLARQQDKLDLTVEKRVYDLLLNQSPFSFSVIRYPWMQETLYVKWPTM